MSVYRRGNKWWVDVVVSGERIRRSAGDTEEAAKTLEAELLGRSLRVKNTVESVLRYTLRTRWAAMLATGQLKKYTSRCNVLIEHFGPLPPDLETVYRVVALLRSKNLNDTSIKQYLGHLTTAVAHCIETGHAVPPLGIRQVVRAFAPKHHRTRVFTPEEQQAALEFFAKRERVGPRLHALFATMFVVGARRGEMLALTVADYDPADKTLRFRAETTKGKKTRVVPCDPVVPLLDALTRGKLPGDLLFGVSQKAVTNGWRAMRMKLGYNHPEMVVHAVRHTVGTRLARTAGLAQAQVMLGHSEANTTMRYVHLEMSDLRAAQRAMCQTSVTTPTELTENDQATT